MDCEIKVLLPQPNLLVRVREKNKTRRELNIRMTILGNWKENGNEHGPKIFRINDA